VKLQNGISNNDVKTIRYLLEQSKLPESYYNISIINYVHDAIHKSRSTIIDTPLLYYSDCKGTEAANVFETYNNINIDCIRIILNNIRSFAYANKLNGVKWVLSKFYLKCNNELEYTEFENLVYSISDSLQRIKNNKSFEYLFKDISMIYDMYIKLRKTDINKELDLYIPISNINNIIYDYIK
jgi:hypothetical protein